MLMPVISGGVAVKQPAAEAKQPVVETREKANAKNAAKQPVGEAKQPVGEANAKQGAKNKINLTYFYQLYIF